MVVLGIDPGYAILGYGIVKETGGSITHVDYGVLETHPASPFPKRIEAIYNGVVELIQKHSPDEVAFEELFFNKNVTTALQVGAGRGVALLAAQQRGLPLYEYTPMQIKLMVTGNGRADKKQVQQMVRLLLSLKEIPRPDDAADALAVAICHSGMKGPAAQGFSIK